MSDFDFVFSSYSDAFSKYGARPDSESRAPWVFSEIWERRSITPHTNRVISITGSKGKGTVARQIAWNLQKTFRVGLVLSPEELSHYDRIRINNVPIDSTSFAKHLDQLELDILEVQSQLPEGRYLSPTGIFLSVALSFFSEQQVDWVVIEGGRGVKYDEIGQIQCRLGVVTSLYDEHVLALGGTLRHVMADKLSLSNCAAKILVSDQVVQTCVEMGYPLPLNAIAALHCPESMLRKQVTGRPAWLESADVLSRKALQLVCPELVYQAYQSPSYSEIQLGEAKVICEPVIHPSSLSPEYLRELAGQDVCVIMGLSDDKHAIEILNVLQMNGLVKIQAFALTSSIGHISSKWIEKTNGIVGNLGPLNCVSPDVAYCKEILLQSAQEFKTIYIIGIQIFMRTVRQVLSIELGCPHD